VASEPWWNWPTRWKIAEEYYFGTSSNTLACRYHHDRNVICAWLRALGLLTTSVRLHIIARTVTPQIHTLAAWLVVAETRLGHAPDVDQIGRIIEEIREMNGGNVSIGSGYHGKEAVAS
jgi:hypothetical protein